MPSEFYVALFAAGVTTIVLVPASAVWGWMMHARYRKHNRTMAALNEIAAEPQEKESWPRSSN